MNGNSVTLIFVLVLLILLSAYFSATETAFSSLNKIRIKNLAASGNKRATQTLAFAEDYDRLLSTILIGNNIVNIASASLATVIFVRYFDDAGVTISTVVMTVLILIFGEISPKSLAKEAPERFAMFSTPILKWLARILRPANFLFAQWKKMLSKVFQVGEARGITEEELLTIVEEAQQDGGINEQEGELIRNAIEFSELTVLDVLTPRIAVIAVEETAQAVKIKQLFQETGFSRLPVYRNSVDQIIGIIYQKDFYNNSDYDTKGIEGILRPTFFAPKTMKITKMLKLLQQTKSHIAVITDEFGGTLGIVTLEDILEELVGEIWDEHDEVVEEIKKIDDKTYRILSSTNLDKMEELFGKTFEGHANTVSGWVLEQFGRIPEQDESFTYEDLSVIVSKTEPHKVLEVIITRLIR